VLDRQLFNPAREDLGRPPFDESPEAYYNVIPDALLVNKNMLQIDMRSTGKRVQGGMQPELEGVTVGSDMKLVDADCAKWEDGWKPPEVLPQADGGKKGDAARDLPEELRPTSYAINVIDRQEYLDRLFRLTWKQLGGKIGAARRSKARRRRKRACWPSTFRARCRKLVRDTNKPSDNTLARTIFLSLGALEPTRCWAAGRKAAAPKQTFSRSDAAVRGWMRAHGIDDTGLVMENGSGLSRTERITPIQMGGVLQAGLRSNWAPEFQASMPIVAVDGTMRRRLKDSPAAGRARLKTGTLSNVVALAGYVPDAQGRQCVVVAMVNSRAGQQRARAGGARLRWWNWVAHGVPTLRGLSPCADYRRVGTPCPPMRHTKRPRPSDNSATSWLTFGTCPFPFGHTSRNARPGVEYAGNTCTSRPSARQAPISQVGNCAIPIPASVHSSCTSAFPATSRGSTPRCSVDPSPWRISQGLTVPSALPYISAACPASSSSVPGVQWRAR
jgi:PBP4 family serine-type D-alanyl-D-alanine carboxypeptidase